MNLARVRAGDSGGGKEADVLRCTTVSSCKSRMDARQSRQEPGLKPPSLSSPPLRNTQSNPKKKEKSLLLSCSGKFEARSSATTQNAKSFLFSCVLWCCESRSYPLPLLLLGQDC